MKNKNIKKIIIRLLISFTILFLLFWGMKDNLWKVKDNILSVNVYVFSLAVLIYIFISFIGAARFRYFLSAHNINIGFIDLLKNIYIGYLFNLFLLGSTGGDVVRSYYISKQTHAKTEVVTMVFFDRLIGMTTMMLIAFSSLVFNLNIVRLRNMFWVVLFMMLGIISFFIVVFKKDAIKNIKLVRFILSKIFFKDKLKEIINAVYVFRENKRMIFTGILFSLAIQILAIIDCYLVGISMKNIDIVHLRYFFLMMPIIFMGSALPVSLGGWGVFEWGFVVCFGMLGVKEADALSIGLMNRFVLIILGVIGAIIYVLPGTEHYAVSAIEEEL